MRVNTLYEAHPLRMYLWWSLCTLYLLACQVRVIIGDSGLCCTLCYVFWALINSLLCHQHQLYRQNSRKWETLKASSWRFGIGAGSEDWWVQAHFMSRKDIFVLWSTSTFTVGWHSLEHFPSELSLYGENTAVSFIMIRDRCVPLVARIEPHPSYVRGKIAVELLSWPPFSLSF